MSAPDVSPAGSSAAAHLRLPDRIYPGYLFDLDGTVYLGEAPLPGAVEALAALRDAGSRTLFLSNKPLEPPEAYARALRGMGIAAERDDVVTSLDALLAYLAGSPERSGILLVAEPLVEGLLREAGHAVTKDPGAADVVVVSWDRGFRYDRLAAAFRAVRGGARIVATNPDPYCPTPDGGEPDCGAILAAIETATGVRAEAVVGKPSAHMASVALDRIGLPPREVVMVGDRLLTDVAMARRAGMTAALVLSGATRPEDLAGADPPDLVLETIGQLVPPAVNGSHA
ncbi:MAG TPA: HAD-IIA family hydrolase [Candidatus Limnocylindrales bacterium]